MFEPNRSRNRVLDQGRDEFLNEVGVVCIHVVADCVGMYPSIIPVLVRVKMIPPDLDEIHHTGNVDMLEEEHYGLSTSSLRHVPSDVMDSLLRDETVDFSQMILASGDKLEHPGVTAPASVITQDLRNQRVQGDAALMCLLFEA